MLAGKKFSANEKVNADSEIYFETKDKSYYKNCFEKLYDHDYRCIAFKGALNNKIKFNQKKRFFFYVTLWTFQLNC